MEGHEMRNKPSIGVKEKIKISPVTYLLTTGV
jgi:hypothetical protein